jgi:hypothetical protein
MKLADLDWRKVLAALPRWQALSPEARGAFVTLHARAARAAHEFPALALAELREAGMVEETDAASPRCGTPAEFRPLLLALKALCQLPAVRTLRRPLDAAVMELQVTPDQMRRMYDGEARYHNRVDRRHVAERVSASDWVRDFLASDTVEAAMAWEGRFLGPRESPHFVFHETTAQTRALLLALTARPEGHPLDDLASLLPDATPAARGAAVGAALRYLLAFASADAATGTAVIGLIPAVARRLSRVAPDTAPADVVEAFSAAVRVLDMTVVLVEAGTEPLLLRGNDGELYVRIRKTIAALLPPVPEWFGCAALNRGHAGVPDMDIGAGADPEEVIDARIAWAMDTLLDAQLAVVRTVRDRAAFLPNKRGREWLARSPGERLKWILDAFRGSPQRRPDRYGSHSQLDYFGAGLGVDLHVPGDLRTEVAAAFLELPEGAFIPVAAWAAERGWAHNPLVAAWKASKPRTSPWAIPVTRDAVEEAWQATLRAFLKLRLVPYGGARLGRTAAGTLAFTLTPAGRYLLGASDVLETEAAPQGEVVVQPDFEVVFLTAAPDVEMEVGRFAERIGSGVGALFRITRASVLRAAEQGLTLADVVATLRNVSRADLPPNVARQVAGWMAATRRVSIGPAVLVECPDADTALQVKGFAGKLATSLSPTVLRLKATDAERKALVKRLRERGIFLTRSG